MSSKADFTAKGRGGTVGMGVWGGSAEQLTAIPGRGKKEKVKPTAKEIMSSLDGKVVKLVTPIRGSVKPLSSAHTKALGQASLLPDMLEQQYVNMGYV